MKKVVIIPTGDEIKAGIVIDTNSPALMGIVLEKYPASQVIRIEPVADEPGEISRSIKSHGDSDLIILIGGSGGGKKFDPSLAQDLTHEVMEKLLTDFQVKEIYGYNGHLWSRLIIGLLGKTVVANVPGPYVEAVAAGRALVQGLAEGKSLPSISGEIARAVMSQYPLGGEIR